MTALDLGKVTWTCHCCGRTRDDADIAVYSENSQGPLPWSVHVRYCADSSSCAEGAPEIAKKWLEVTPT